MTEATSLRARVGNALWRFCFRRPRDVWEALALLGMIAAVVVAIAEA